MNPSLRWLYLVIFTGLLLEPCGLSGKSRAVAVTCVELTVFEVGNLPQTSDCRVEKESDESEKRAQKAEQHRQALLLLLQMIHAASMNTPELRVPEVAADLLSAGRTEMSAEEYLIRGPPAPG